MDLRALRGKSLRAVVALLCSTILIFIGLSIFSIIKTRQSYLNEARIKSSAQAQLLAENTASAFFAVDLTLLSFRLIFFQQQAPDHPPTFPAAQFIASELRFLPQIQDLVLLDSKGGLVYSSAGTDAFELSAFNEHRDAWLDFSVDTVIDGKNQAKIVLSRRLENRDAEFAGVLAAVVRPDFFYGRFSDYLNIDVSAIVLVDETGRILTGWFENLNLAIPVSGAPIKTIPHFSSFSESIAGGGGLRTYESGTVLVSTCQLSGYPYQVAVSYSKKQILERWRQEAGRNAAVLFVATLIAAYAGIQVYRHWRHRQQAELALRRHQSRLEQTVAERTAQLTEINRKMTQKKVALEKALAEVKTLSGLVPICSHCKKIRDDTGYWNRIETYVHRSSGTEFSHSICPDCEKKFYSDLADDEKT